MSEDMFFVDVAGHIGYVGLAVGMLLIARGNRQGWIWRFIGEAIWLIIGIYLNMTSMYLWGAAFLGIDAIGFVSSHRETKKRGKEARGEVV